MQKHEVLYRSLLKNPQSGSNKFCNSKSPTQNVGSLTIWIISAGNNLFVEVIHDRLNLVR